MWPWLDVQGKCLYNDRCSQPFSPSIANTPSSIRRVGPARALPGNLSKGQLSSCQELSGLPWRRRQTEGLDRSCQYGTVRGPVDQARALVWCRMGAYSPYAPVRSQRERIARELMTPWLFSCGGRL